MCRGLLVSPAVVAAEASLGLKTLAASAVKRALTKMPNCHYCKVLHVDALSTFPCLYEQTQAVASRSCCKLLLARQRSIGSIVLRAPACRTEELFYSFKALDQAELCCKPEKSPDMRRGLGRGGLLDSIL